jgi:F-type H+-transporting ATPase subunit epsilon
VSELRLCVLTPEATVLDETVDEVVAPLPDGWIGVLPGHASFQARLMRGMVVVRAGGRERTIATLGGTIIVVSPADITMLVGAAALDSSLPELESGIGEQARDLAEMEREAERHFDRIYRAVARTFKERG